MRNSLAKNIAAHDVMIDEDSHLSKMLKARTAWVKYVNIKYSTMQSYDRDFNFFEWICLRSTPTTPSSPLSKFLGSEEIHSNTDKMTMRLVILSSNAKIHEHSAIAFGKRTLFNRQKNTLRSGNMQVSLEECELESRRGHLKQRRSLKTLSLKTTYSKLKVV